MVYYKGVVALLLIKHILFKSLKSDQVLIVILWNWYGKSDIFLESFVTREGEIIEKVI